MSVCFELHVHSRRKRLPTATTNSCGVPDHVTLAVSSLTQRPTNAGKPTSLDLSFTEVSDVGLKELANLPSLSNLDLRGTKVTDAGLKGLAIKTNLTSLQLGSSKVTIEGVRELRTALPLCDILK